jgi:hypothetical protein
MGAKMAGAAYVLGLGSRLRPVALLAAFSCAPPSAEPLHWLELTQARPIERAEVFLNERLVLHFSEPLDPSSVHSSSVRIRDEDGREARGRWHVVADRLEFTPDPVLAPDLSDGGFRPAGVYTVQLVGFPAPDGLRGRSGAPLAANRSLDLRVAALETRGERPLFEDSSPTRGLPLVLSSPVVAEGDPILLLGEEPVDPSSLAGADFELVKRSAGGALPRSAGVPLTARLVQNYDKRATFAEGGAVVELRPRDTPLEPGAYVLRMARDGRVNDLGGHAMILVSPTATRSLELRVEAGRPAGRDGLAAHLESFSSALTRSGEVWEDSDGAAWWRDSGRVEVRLPRLVGEGYDGEVQLRGAFDSDDLHATRLRLEVGEVAHITRAEGLVLLRAQASVRISGQLSRARSAAASTRDCEVEWLAALQGEPLDAERALAKLVEQGVTVTVIVAGGDMVIDGRLEFPTPVILIAGGRIRIARQAHVETQRLWFLDLSTESIAHHVSGARIGAGQRLAWSLAPLERNVLRTPLRLAVVSGSLPPRGARRFEYGPRITARQGAGLARVRYLGDRPVGASSRSPAPLVDDPALLMGCSTLRLLIELEVFPAEGPSDEAWDPPWVDDVLIEYEPAAGPLR